MLLLSTPLNYPVNMFPAVSPAKRLVFGPFEADLHSGELRKNGTKVRLQAQPFQLLVMLLERPSELVTREEIRLRLWSADTFVDFDHSLGSAINKVREALADSAFEPSYIETLPRRGYRFLGEVTSIEPHPAVSEISTEVATDPLPKRRIRVLAICAAGVICLATIAWSVRVGKSHTPNELSPVRSIAVLPLVNLSNDRDQQFFADGVTDELITSLAQISSLRVTSRTSTMGYQSTLKPAAQIAKELGVDALVEGSVVRSGSRVRITAQLIRVPSDRHLWAQSYDRELSDILTVQGEVARNIAESISLHLTSKEQSQLSLRKTVDPEVALLIFKGQYLLKTLELERAKAMFSQATQRDPGNAEAWAGLADTLHTAGVEGDYPSFLQAKRAATKALEIDPAQPQALMVLGVISFLYDWNPGASEEYFRRAIEAQPNYAVAHMLFANTLAHQGRVEEAIREVQLGNASDPVSVESASLAWHTYFCARRYEDALKLLRSAIEVDPSFKPLRWRLSVSLEQRGEYLEAIDAGYSGQDALSLKQALTKNGADGYWQRKLELLVRDRDPKSRYEFSSIARCYMHLGRREDAIRTLQTAYELRDPFLIFWLSGFEEFDSLHADPRIQEISRGLGKV